MVVIKFKNIRKRCVSFVVPGNGQVLPRMPDTAALKLININIDSIQADIVECKTNIEQETHVMEKGCANMDAELKNKCNQNINYFFSSNVGTDKRKCDKLMQALGASRAHSLYSLSQTANCIKHHPGVQHMQYKNHSRRNWNACRRWT